MKNRSIEDVSNALQKLTGITKNESTDIGQANEIAATPDTNIDVPVGIRDAILKRINPNATDGFTHEILFSETNTTVWAKLSSTGVISTPKGEWKNGIFYVSEAKTVHASIIKDTLKWQIVGEEINLDEKNIVSGTRVINQGDTKITVSDDSTKVTKGETELLIDGTGVYVNGTKIPQEQAAKIWFSLQSFIAVSFNNSVEFFDLQSGEWVDSVPLPNIKFLSVYRTPFMD